jgi:primary-amine oxidase
MDISQIETRNVADAAVLHPLDPLGLEEIRRACHIVRVSEAVGAAPRFALVELKEPEKSEVVAGKAVARRAVMVVMDTNGATHEVVVDLDKAAISSNKPVPLDTAPFGQPPVMLEEFKTCEEVVKADAGWRAAMRRRGLSEEDLERVQVDPFSAGQFGYAEEAGQRLVRAVCYYRERITDNAYSHPIEGVVAVVDLVGKRVLRLIDDEKIIPIPKAKHNYDGPSLPKARTDLKPLDIIQPQGPSFTVDGWKVSWQNWSFRVGFTPREGLVLHQLGFSDKGRERPIIYRASVSEMVVPYADPTTNHYWKSAFDAGEYGLGKLANQLELGCDCLGHIRYFDIPMADDHGEPFLMRNAVCLHEEDYGILWKHFDFRTGVLETRRSRRLVISFFATVGNYDYGFYWHLYQDGTIELQAKLTGIIQTAAVAPGEAYPYGGMVADRLGGPTHQHLFNARLHMMVDGEKNRVTEHEFKPRPFGDDNPHGNVFDVTSQVLAYEQEAGREANAASGRFWKITNPNRSNAVGQAPGYKLVAQPGPLLLAQEGSAVRARAGFATKTLWVTRYDPAERYAAGDYPNQHAGGDGVIRYAAQSRPIDNEDVVLWHSFGLTHLCKPEDFPVMPVEYTGFTLKPTGFFDANPTLDLPGDRNAHSVAVGSGEAGQGSDTCSRGGCRR